MNIRYAEPTDKSWLAENDHYIDLKLHDEKIKNKKIIILSEEKNIGLLRYSLFWDNTPFMNMLYFLEEYRHKGYGRSLVNFWENEMKEQGYKYVLTSTLSNEPAQHFYRKLGYKDIGGFILPGEALELIFIKQF